MVRHHQHAPRRRGSQQRQPKQRPDIPALDPFGRTEERKTERALITHYRDTIAALCSSLTTDNLPHVVEVASIPEEIRGYGHVKERHLRNAKEKEAQLLKALEGGSTMTVKEVGRHAACRQFTAR